MQCLPRSWWFGFVGAFGMAAPLHAAAETPATQPVPSCCQASASRGAFLPAAPPDAVPQPDHAVTKPKALEPGDTIMFVAPAGELIEDRVMLARQRLEAMGFNVVLPDGLFRRTAYLAGPDEVRAAELMAAFTDPDVDAVFPGTGGYGATRILDLLDFDSIAANPKVFIGFSDITALHQAIHQRTGLVTFHSPNPQWGLGSDNGFHPLAEKYFWRTLLASSYEQDGKRGEEGKGFAYEFGGYEDVAELETIAPGKATGRMIGGNLSLLAATMGTPFEIETEGRVLFMEDVREAPYRVDRMLQQLESAGKLDNLAGAVIGYFTRAEPDDDEGKDTWDVDDVIRQYFADRNYPVLGRVPVGHVRWNTTFPVGGLVEVDADAKTLRLVEDPVTLPGRVPR